MASSGVGKLSGALMLTDLNDFITPSQACVKPVEISKTSDAANVKRLADGTIVEQLADGSTRVLEPAKISLNDCLACSGCITSAESILVNAQSVSEFLATVRAGERQLIVSVSPQSRASIAAQLGVSPAQAFARLRTLFMDKLGATHVLDTSFSRDFSLLESVAEFQHRLSAQQQLPVLSSACPGWVCYAEKTHGDWILPLISTVKSPQQVMGSLVKDWLVRSGRVGVSPEQIYHVSVMPCYDKKLEASRDDFYNDVLGSHDVDLVLTTTEVLDLAADLNVPSIAALPESPLDPPLLLALDTASMQLVGVPGGSGGYAEYVFRMTVLQRYGVALDRVEWRTLRNQDFSEAVYEHEGQVVLRFARAYGFRNLQRLIRKAKLGKSEYHYVEVMACPSGCLNGGGQLRHQPPEAPRQRLALVDQLYHQGQLVRLPQDNPDLDTLYQTWVGGAPFSAEARRLLHTQYHGRDKVANPLTISW